MSRLSPGTLLLGIVAILFGLLGAYVVRTKLQAQPVEAEAPEEPQLLVVPTASTDLPAGREITLGDIAVARLTRQQLKKQGITQAFMANTTQIIGRVLRVPLKRGDTFDTTCFYSEGTGPNVAERLKPGYRAVTVTVEMDAAVAGFAGAGSWVDVLFRSEADLDRDLPEQTVSLIRGVEVLALNRETNENTRVRLDNTRRQASVTLAVSPDQAAILRVVEGRGSLSLSLRRADDLADDQEIRPLTLDELLERRTEKKHEMEIYRGRQLSNVEFERDRRTTPSEKVAGDDDTPPRRAALETQPAGGN